MQSTVTTLTHTILSALGVTQKIRASLTPIRQEVKPIPESYNIAYENITLETEDNLLLRGWWIEGKSDTTILLSHSFSANRSGWEGADASGNPHQINWLPSIQVLAQHGYNIIAFDHRACGESEGELTYFGKKEAMDIMSAVAWVREREPIIQKFGFIGFSTGANAILRAMAILEKESPELQLAGVAVNLYWYEKMIANSTKFFTGAPFFLTPIIRMATIQIVGFDPAKEINPSKSLSEIESPIMIVNSEFDEIATLSTIKEIYNARERNTELVIAEGEDRFYSYHFIEREPKRVIEYMDRVLKVKHL